MSVAMLASSGASVGLLVYLVFIAFEYACLWRIFTKAGQFGWAAIIPIYNVWVLLKVVRRPGWWLLLLLVPLVNFVIAIILALDLAKSFKKGTGFAIGLIFLPFIFGPILAFGDATYAPVQHN